MSGLAGNSGLKSAGGAPTAAQVLAALVGQNIVAASVSATAAATPLNAASGPATVSSLVTTQAATAITMNGSQSRLTFDTSQYITSIGGTGRMLSTGGYEGPAFAMGASGTGHAFALNTAPTIVAGAGASVTNNNGTVAFTINLGGAAQTGTITLPAATAGWVCYMQDITTPASFVISQTGGTASTVTFTCYSRTTGLAINWTANDVMACIAMAY